MRTGTRGFTLIEMMIVVAIIAVIAAIAIPNLIQSRVRANEATAIENLRVVSAAQFSYHAAKSAFGDFAELASDVDGAGTGFLDPSWHDGVVKTGYAFTMSAATTEAFECYADPVQPGSSGVRFFRVDASGIVRFSHTARPDASAPAIGQ